MWLDNRYMGNGIIISLMYFGKSRRLYLGLLCKTKIAYFLDIPKGLGGAGNLLLQQAKLMSHVFDVIVVVPCNDDGIANDEYIRRCEISHISYKVLKYNTAYNFYDVDFLSALETREQIREWAIEEKITFFHSVQLNIAVEMVARELQIPHLMNIYQLQPDEFKIMYGDLYPQYHLCDSEMYSNLWSNKLGIESKCIRPVAPLNQIEKKDGYSLDDFTIVMLGAVCDRKNQLTAIKAVEKCIKKYNFRLIIAGNAEGRYANLCKNYVKENGLENKIQFLGFVKDISNILLQSECLLCTSLDESFPSSIVEAVTHDLTIVTTPVAGVPEVFRNGYNSFVSKDFKLDSICESLVECLESYKNGNITRIHLNEELTWKENFAPNTVRKQIEQYYKEIIGRFVSKENVLKEISNVVESTFKLLQPIYKNEHIVKQRCLYYAFLRDRLEAGKSYIWGAGKYGRLAKEILEIIRPDIEIVGFIDRMKEGTYLDTPIICPKDIQYLEVNYVFIGFGYGYNQGEVIDFLEKRHFNYNDKVWRVP